MSNLKVNIELDNEQTTFRPGERISGRVSVEAPSMWEADFLELIIFWRTEGRGTEDTASILHEKYHDGMQNVSPQFQQSFAVQLPDMPWTYYGDLIKIHWYVGLYAKEKGESEEYLEVNFVLHPNPELLSVRK
ncbi:hypothetical protein KQI84_13600 [bacterium]|nr:hypothetical protein [bacterium]